MVGFPIPQTYGEGSKGGLLCFEGCHAIGRVVLRDVRLSFHDGPFIFVSIKVGQK